MSKIKHILIFGMLLIAGSLKAQIYPIQATTQLVPPYAVYLPDYATGINNQLRVLLLNKDVTQPDYKVKLVMGIELNGSLIMRTSDTYAPGPITLQPNQPFSVEGLELAPYMNSANIDFIGYSRQDYEQKKGLPEGAYKICFTAYDYYRPDRVQVSNHGCSFYYLTKNDPPFVNMPACGLFITPQQDDKENLIDKAGRWLSYTLDMPWDNGAKNSWYSAVSASITNIFAGQVVNGIAKDQLQEIGRQYAVSHDYDWDAAYGNAWKTLVFEELAKDEFIYWSRDRVKLGSTSYNINPVPVTGALGDADVATDVDLQPYEISGVPGNTNINFMWTPRHTSSPNSTLSTRYKIELYEVRPKVPNEQLPAMANNAVMTGQPVFTDETTLTTYTYGPDKPQLIDGLQYAWRIKAFDAGGRDWFKNNGYSEVCYFTFGGVYNPAQNVPGMEEINTFNAQAETERRGLGQWQQTGGYTGYRVRYRRKNGSGTWFEVDTDSLRAKLYDLEPSTAYQAQVQGKAGQYYGPFSPVKEFVTPAPTPPPGCGLPITFASGLSNEPLQLALPLMIVKCGKFEMLVDSVEQSGSPGYYSGSGRIFNIPFLAIVQVMGAAMGNTNSGFGTGLKVTYNNIFINKDREVTQGLIYAVTRPLEEWVADFDKFYKEVREEKQQEDNRKKFAWLDSNAVMLPFDYTITGVTFDKQTGVVTMTDDKGNTYTYTLKPEEKGHDVIIQGNDGNQWVIDKDGKVQAAPGGGLYPGFNRPVSADDINIIKLAVQKLKNDYPQTRIQQINNEYKSARDARSSLLSQTNSVVSPATVNTDKYGVIFLGMVDKENEQVQMTPYNQADITFRNKEVLKNKAALVVLFTKEINTDKEYTLICRALKIGDKNVMDFIKEKKAANVSMENIVTEIKNSLDSLLETIIK
jgi:hypothetical protein